LAGADHHGAEMRDTEIELKDYEIPPIVVFGTGGSGTRAVAQYLSACGIRMGNNVNVSGDAMAFVPAASEYADRVVEAARGLDYDPDRIEPELRNAVIHDYRKAAILHREGVPKTSRWGFKQPRSILMLPLIESAFPDARFVHVVRDGRDMMLSRNRNQPQRYFEALFQRPFGHSETDIALYWAKTNMDARAFGMRCLKDRYTILRIEDACGPNRLDVLRGLGDAIGLDSERVGSAADVFKHQETFGRGLRQLDETDQNQGFRAALAAFNY
jgi:hypothetical protein